jgi:hypothetical protein
MLAARDHVGRRRARYRRLRMRRWPRSFESRGRHREDDLDAHLTVRPVAARLFTTKTPLRRCTAGGLPQMVAQNMPPLVSPPFASLGAGDHRTPSTPPPGRRESRRSFARTDPSSASISASHSSYQRSHSSSGSSRAAKTSTASEGPRGFKASPSPVGADREAASAFPARPLERCACPRRSGGSSGEDAVPPPKDRFAPTR